MTVLSIREIYDAARGAGFDPHQAVTWTSIVLAESGGRTTALNKGEHPLAGRQFLCAEPGWRGRLGGGRRRRAGAPGKRR